MPFPPLARFLMGVLVVTVFAAWPALAEDYDVVIINGRVMDPETLYDDVANVGIKDGRIATSPKRKSGPRNHQGERHRGRPRLHRHPFPLSNADRLFPRVARWVDQQHGFRDGLCGILYRATGTRRVKV